MKLSGTKYEAGALDAGAGTGAPTTGSNTGTPGTIDDGGLLRDLVSLIPNPAPDWEFFVNVGRAIWGASSGSGREAFAEWAAKLPGGDDPAVTEARWDSYHDASIGRGWLLREATAADPAGVEAWLRKEAAALFDDGVDVTQAHDEPAAIASGASAAYRLVDTVKFQRRPWLYGRRLMRGYVSSTIAAGGTGKSSLVMTEIMAMVTGKDLLGSKVRAPLRVWMWNGEDDLTELGRRLHAIALHYGINDADLGDRLYVDSGREKAIAIATQAGVNSKVVEGIKKVIRERRIDVLVIDPFVSSHRVSENDNMAIDLVAKTLSQIAEQCHCAVDLVHHVRKPGNGVTASASVDDARGASSLINATRHSRVIAPMTKQIAAKLGIANHRSHFAIQHDATKANMVPPGVGEDWYKFESVGLGNGEANPVDGLGPIPEDSVGVVTRWTPPAVTLADDPVKARAVQDAVARGSYRSSSKADDWVGPVIAGALGIDIDAAGGKALVDEVMKAHVRRGWLKISEKTDATRHKRSYVEVGERAEIGAVFDDEEVPASVASV